MLLRDAEIIKQLKETGDTHTVIAARVGCSRSQVTKVSKSNFTEEEMYSRGSRNHNSRTQPKKLGVESPLYKGGLSHDGYRVVRRPEWYNGSQCRHTLEHILVACQAADITRLPPGYVVHHLDFTKLNNDSANLIIVTRQQHVRIHKQAMR